MTVHEIDVPGNWNYWSDGRALEIDVDDEGYAVLRTEDGFMNEDVVNLFTMGQCHHLALELHRLTGWPMVVLADVVPPSDFAPGASWIHAAVRHPDGGYVDIKGHTDDDTLGYGYGYIYDLDPDDTPEIGYPLYEEVAPVARACAFSVLRGLGATEPVPARYTSS